MYQCGLDEQMSPQQNISTHIHAQSIPFCNQS